jgi:hypothetical protein
MDQRSEKDNPVVARQTEYRPRSPQGRAAFIRGSTEHAFFRKMR